MDINKVILKGRVAGDISTDVVNGTTVMSFVLATNRVFRRSDGERIDEASFVPVESWGVVADAMLQRLSKGTTVLIDGRLKQDKWVSKDGQKRSKIKVVVESFDIIE